MGAKTPMKVNTEFTMASCARNIRRLHSLHEGMPMKTLKTIFAAAVLVGVGQIAWAASAGTTGAEILKIGVGARAIGMGEAYTAQADDVSSLYWNPAGLALMQERQASFMYDKMYQDLSFQNANIGIPLENGAIGG